MVYRALEWTLSAAQVTGPAMAKGLGIDLKLAKALISRLEKEGVLGAGAGKKGT